jgi:hypothetical protein
MFDCVFIKFDKQIKKLFMLRESDQFSSCEMAH